MTTLYLILAGAGVIGLLALLYGRQSRKRGRAEANAEGLESAVDAARKSGAIDEEVSRMPDADLYDELHNGGRD
ncbi:MAG: hypothetical protein KAR37_16325 [Alphaproteobacteria bacterium]|jgi:hypothetical protein|nr:hypothetical protein [Alphaproteobacteria bacterium]